MKEQRWPGDYQTISQEFVYSRMEEEIGLRGQNLDRLHDYIAKPEYQLDAYQKKELEPSWSMQLDTVGMQPHSREYLERQMNCMRSDRKYEMIAGEMIDYSPGIHFDGMP